MSHFWQLCSVSPAWRTFVISHTQRFIFRLISLSSTTQTYLVIIQHWLQQNGTGLQQDCQNCVFLMKRAAKLATRLIFCLSAFYPWSNKLAAHSLVTKHWEDLQLPVFVFPCGTSQPWFSSWWQQVPSDKGGAVGSAPGTSLAEAPPLLWGSSQPTARVQTNRIQWREEVKIQTRILVDDSTYGWDLSPIQPTHACTHVFWVFKEWE